MTILSAVDRRERCLDPQGCQNLQERFTGGAIKVTAADDCANFSSVVLLDRPDAIVLICRYIRSVTDLELASTVTASQQTGQQRRSATNGTLNGLAVPVRVIGDHTQIALKLLPIDVAFVPVMQQHTPFLAWQTHAVADAPTAILQLGLPTVAAVGIRSCRDRVGQLLRSPL